MKDAAMIDRIIATESLKCYLLTNPRKADGTPKYKTFRPYSLNSAALEALEIKNGYNAGDISEEELKAYCLKYNVAHQSDTPAPAALEIMKREEAKQKRRIYIY